MDLSHRDYSLEVSPASAAEVCHARLLARPNGSVLHEYEIEAFPPLDLEREVAAFPGASGVAQEELARSLGGRLFDLLLPPPARGCIHTPGLGIRLSLHIQPPRLAALPWELMRCGEAGLLNGSEDFLCLNRAFHLVRTEAQSRLPARTGDRLRLLLAWANPHDAEYGALASVPCEVDAVKRALGAPECEGVEVKEIPHASSATLRQALAEERPHILHFAGHAEASTGGGYLILCGDAGSDKVPAAALHQWLVESQTAAAVFTACSTAARDGVARYLARKGLPCTLGMRIPLSDSAGPPFARAFYAALAAGQPVEEAAAQARIAIRGMGAAIWASPVVFLNALDEPVIHIARAAANNLPRRPDPRFCGRESLLAELHTWLESNPRQPVALTGMSGQGKSAVAREYAHRHLESYPGGVFWVKATDARTLEDELIALAPLLGIPDAIETEVRLARVKDRLQRSGRPTLMILDGWTAAAQSQYLPATGQCRVLATTQDSLADLQAFHTLAVPPLGEEAARALLQSFQSADTGDERAAVDEIVEKVGRLAVALEACGGLARRKGLDYRTVAAGLKGRDSAEFLSYAFQGVNLAVSCVGGNALRVMQAASCFAGERIQRDHLARASGIDSGWRFADALEDLKRHSLVVEEVGGQIGLHDFMRECAYHTIPGEEKWPAIGRTAATLAAALLEAGARRDWKAAQALVAHCEAAASRSQALLEESGRAPCPQEVAALFRALGCYRLEQGYRLPALERFKRALELLEGSSPLKLDLLLTLAEECQYAANGHDDPAYGPQALAYARQALELALDGGAGLASREAACCLILGFVHKKQQRFQEALHLYRRALRLTLARHGRSHRETAQCLNNLGTLFESTARLRAAEKCLRQALALDRDLCAPDDPKLATGLNNLGRITQLRAAHLEACASESALEYYQREYARDTRGLEPGFIATIRKLAGREPAPDAIALWNAALGWHSESLQIYTAAHGERHPDVAASLTYRGLAHYALGQADDSLACLERAEAMYAHFYGEDDYRTVDSRARTMQCKIQLGAVTDRNDEAGPGTYPHYAV